MKKATIAVMALAACMAPRADAAAPVKTVKGEYTFYGDRSHSVADCERMALEGARIEALRLEYGTVLTHDLRQSERMAGGEERSDVLVLSSAEVKGEWLGDDAEPVFEYSYTADNLPVVTCRVKGKARALSNDAPKFDTFMLRNGTSKSNAETRFNVDDSVYVYFSGASDGYVAVYLDDHEGNVYTLLPYPSQSGPMRVKRNYEYVFFDRRRDDQAEELMFSSSEPVMYNTVYVVYSPEQFSGMPMHSVSTYEPPSARKADFERWLLKSRSADPGMAVGVLRMQIDNQEAARMP